MTRVGYLACFAAAILIGHVVIACLLVLSDLIGLGLLGYCLFIIIGTLAYWYRVLKPG